MSEAPTVIGSVEEERQKLRDWLDGLHTVNVEWAPAHGAPFFSKYIVMPGVEVFIDRILKAQASEARRNG